MRTHIALGLVLATGICLSVRSRADRGNPVFQAASPVVQMTAYAAGCRAVDRKGGGDESKWSRLRPSRFTLDRNSQYTMIAVSEYGGTIRLRGQCLRAAGGIAHDRSSQAALNEIQSRILVAADECPGCSNRKRVDVSVSCRSGLSSRLLLNGVQLTPVPCPAQIRQAMIVSPRVADADLAN